VPPQQFLRQVLQRSGAPPKHTGDDAAMTYDRAAKPFAYERVARRKSVTRTNGR